MNELQEKLFNLIGNKIVFSESILEKFFEVSDITHDKNSDFRQIMWNFILNQNNCQKEILSDPRHKYASDIQRLARFQLNAYIHEQKYNIVSEYLEAMKAVLNKTPLGTPYDLSSAEYQLIQHVGEMKPEEINRRTLRACISVMLLFSEHIYHQKELDELLEAIDFSDIRL